MTINKKVSVIMSTYNDGEYLKEALHSILWQTYKDIEIILIDDCSTDNAEEIVSSINDSRIKYYRNTERQGLTRNLNKALNMASGRYIARMDSDDISFPTRLEKQLKYLEDNNYDLIGSDALMFGNYYGRKNTPSDSREISAYMLFNSILPHPTFLFKRQIIDDGLRYNEQYTYAQDYDFVYRISRKYHVGCMPEELLLYRLHSKQISSEKNDVQKKCAENIRKCILKDQNIRLNEKELRGWNEICYKYGRVDHEITIDEFIFLCDIMNKVYLGALKSGEYSTEKVKAIMMKCYYSLLEFLKDNDVKTRKTIEKRKKRWKYYVEGEI